MKGKRTDFGTADCAIARSLQVIGDWWSLLIIRDAFCGKQRFNEFQKSLGLAKNILSSRLKKLVEHGIFRIETGDGSSARTSYVLTEKGEGLYVVLVALWQWGEHACFEPDELNLTMVDNFEGAPLDRLEVKAQTGRPIGPRDYGLRMKAD